MENKNEEDEYCRCENPVLSKRCDIHPDQYCDWMCNALMVSYCTICLNYDRRLEDIPDAD